MNAGMRPSLSACAVAEDAPADLLPRRFHRGEEIRPVFPASMVFSLTPSVPPSGPELATDIVG